MKSKIVFMFLSLILMVTIGCDGPRRNSDKEASAKQEQVAQEIAAQTGMPSVVNASMKKQLKMIIEECDRPNLVCYAYTFSEISGKYVFFGKCIGYGVPYATQYTNPEKIAESFQKGYAILPQADPDGLFKPSSSTATWLMMINPTNPDDIRPVYVEPTIIVSPFPLT